MAVTTSASMQVRVTILAFDDLCSHLPDSAGQPMLEFTCDPFAFAKPVWLAASRVRAAWPGNSCREKWGQHDFPTQALALLEAKLGSRSGTPG
jgi:hypothetical protein